MTSIEIPGTISKHLSIPSNLLYLPIYLLTCQTSFMYIRQIRRLEWDSSCSFLPVTCCCSSSTSEKPPNNNGPIKLAAIFVTNFLIFIHCMGTDADRGFRLLLVYFGGIANAMSPKSKYSGVSYYDWFAELKNYPYLCGSAGIKFYSY